MRSLNTAVPPRLNLNFLTGDALDPRITFSRGTTATYFNSAGVLATAGTSDARFDYNPSTLAAQGLLIEEQRTNSIRNNTMQGAVAGTPGTAPTNWTISTTNAELVSSVIGTGTESGITYIDVRISGTMTASRDLDIAFEVSNNIAALNAQTWAESVYLREVGGSQTNISAIYLQANTYTAASVYVNSPWFATKTVTTAALATQKFSESQTLSGATIAFIQPLIKVRTAASGAVNFTLRIGLPQLEQGAFATSVIPTTTTALTRNADVASMTGTNFSSWYNQSAGTFLTVYSLARPVSGSNQFIVRASDNGYNNSVVINTNSTGFAAIATASGGVFDGVASAAPPLTANVTARVAGCYATNDLALSLNGAAVVTDTSATIPTALTRVDIGSDHAGVNRIQGGYIQRISYYPVRLPNSTLQALTA